MTQLRRIARSISNKVHSLCIINRKLGYFLSLSENNSPPAASLFSWYHLSSTVQSADAFTCSRGITARAVSVSVVTIVINPVGIIVPDVFPRKFRGILPFPFTWKTLPAMLTVSETWLSWDCSSCARFLCLCLWYCYLHGEETCTRKSWAVAEKLHNSSYKNLTYKRHWTCRPITIALFSHFKYLPILFVP